MYYNNILFNYEMGGELKCTKLNFNEMLFLFFSFDHYTIKYLEFGNMDCYNYGSKQHPIIYIISIII